MEQKRATISIHTQDKAKKTPAVCAKTPVGPRRSSLGKTERRKKLRREGEEQWPLGGKTARESYSSKT